MSECPLLYVKLIPLSRRKDKYAIVDAEDYDFLSQWNWTYYAHRRTFYAKRFAGARKAQKAYYMHREIISTPLGMATDHINGNGLDNRRCNLRACSPVENLYGMGKRQGTVSRYKGVAYKKDTKKWFAQIMHHRKHYNLGYYNKEEDAAKRYNEVAVQMFGEYARLNII
jgi:hypothetical protein